jgi:hypothetical protein
MCKTVIKEARLKKCEYLIERYNFKKQYKCTTFKKADFKDDLEEEKIEKYMKQIKIFFKDKN